MIKDLYTVITNTAMAAPGWSVELASDAPLHPNRDSIDLHVPIKRSSEVIISILIWTCSWYHTRVHKSGHRKIDEDKKRDDPLEDRNSVPLLLQNVPFDTREIEEQCRSS